jgi:hypothetical protein
MSDIYADISVLCSSCYLLFHTTPAELYQENPACLCAECDRIGSESFDNECEPA